MILRCRFHPGPLVICNGCFKVKFPYTSIVLVRLHGFVNSGKTSMLSAHTNRQDKALIDSLFDHKSLRRPARLKLHGEDALNSTYVVLARLLEHFTTIPVLVSMLHYTRKGELLG